ncbi:MAG: ShlB/FhaC/HecB family hemolysin secretion/activation protein [Alkalinema sp. RU_4_3]|nr:ShlB/FhaC/HecB family hemolysin secretion/activation protein [Alkalinema sp. RU_4_3]
MIRPHHPLPAHPQHASPPLLSNIAFSPLGLNYPSPPAIAAPEKLSETPKTVQVDRFQILGSTVFDQWELANITQPYEGRRLTLEEMQTAADAVTRYYLDHGYLTSRAILADQTLQSGTIKLQILEGKLADITIQGDTKLPKNYVRQRLLRAGRQPLNQEALESQLQLLRTDPLFDAVEGVLRDGTAPTETNLDVKVQPARPQFATLSLDNHGSPTVGRITLSALTGIQNATNHADTLSLGLVRSAGTQLYNLTYQRPLNPNQGTLTFRIAPVTYRVTQSDLQTLNITGTGNLYNLTLRQPLTRQITQEFALTAGITQRSGKTLIADTLIDENGTTTLHLGQDWLKRDKKGLWTAKTQLNLGKAKNTTDNTTDTFLTWTGQIQRIHKLSKKQTLTAELNWQWAPNALPPAQQFTLGGFQSLRGYPSSFLSGDGGLTLTLTNQITLQKTRKGDPRLQIAPFLDFGTLWQAIPPTVPTQNPLFLSSGLTLTWNPRQNWTLSADLALPLSKTNLETPPTPTLYLNSNYRF